MFAQMTHHLVFMLKRHIEEKYSNKGYKVFAPADFSLLISGSQKKMTPAIAVFGPDSSEIPVLVADVDTQSCGPQKNFSDVIQTYASAGVSEYWIFYTKDHLIITRRKEENGFGKHKVFSESDLLVAEGLFPLFAEK